MGRKRVDQNMLEKTSSTFEGLLADIAEWEAHPSRSAKRAAQFAPRLEAEKVINGRVRQVVGRSTLELEA
jgi:hypothetical protein